MVAQNGIKKQDMLFFGKKVYESDFGMNILYITEQIKDLNGFLPQKGSQSLH